MRLPCSYLQPDRSLVDHPNCQIKLANGAKIAANEKLILDNCKVTNKGNAGSVPHLLSWVNLRVDQLMRYPNNRWRWLWTITLEKMYYISIIKISQQKPKVVQNTSANHHVVKSD